MSRGRRRPDDAAGFTLIELLVALALLGLLALVIFGELNFGTRAWQTAARVDEDAEAVAAAQALMRLKLAAAYPILTRATDRERHVDFDGARDAVSFVGFLPDRAGTNITAKIGFRAAPMPDQTGLRLIASWRPDLGVGSARIAPVETVLLERIAALRLSYYGRRPGDPTPQWSREWSDMKDLPLLVSLDVGFPEGDRRTWPEMTVAPRIRADVTCVFDPLTRDCRPR